MKIIVMMLLMCSLAYAGEVTRAPDGTYVDGVPQRTPDGKYVGGGEPMVGKAPDWNVTWSDGRTSRMGIFNDTNDTSNDIK